MTGQNAETEQQSPSQAWHRDHFDEIVRLHERSRNLRVAEAAQIVGANPRVKIPSGLRDVESIERTGATSGILARATSAADVLANAEQFVRYAIQGATYKARAVCSILNGCGIQDASLLDIGGAWGAVAAEAVDLPNSPVAEATTVDRIPGNAVIASMLLEAVGNGRLRHICGDAPDFAPSASVAAISILSSMLYMPRSALPRMLRAFWDAVLPGGVLIVFENYRQEHTPEARDTHLMFTEAEMAYLLRPFGNIFYFDHKKDRVTKQPQRFCFLRKN